MKCPKSEICEHIRKKPRFFLTKAQGRAEVVMVLLVVAFLLALVFLPQINKLTGAAVAGQETKIQIEKNKITAINLSSYFPGIERTYLATEASNIQIEMKNNLLVLTPDKGFVGQRLIKVFAAAEEVKELQFFVEVYDPHGSIISTIQEEQESFQEEEETAPALEASATQITEEPEATVAGALVIQGSHILEIDLSNFFKSTEHPFYATGDLGVIVEFEEGIMKISRYKDFVGNQEVTVTSAGEDFEEHIFHITVVDEESAAPESVISEPSEVNETEANETETNVTEETTETNATIKAVQQEEIKIDNKHIGKKLEDEPDFDVIFANVVQDNETLTLIFYHNSSKEEKIYIDGKVTHTLSTKKAEPFENITLEVTLEDGILPQFELHVGDTSEKFKFGKKIPKVKLKEKKIKKFKDKDGNKTWYKVIDRDDELVDLLIRDKDASVYIKGINVTDVNGLFEWVTSTILTTEIFAADPIDMEAAVITLPRTDDVTAIVECPDFNLSSRTCPSDWTVTTIPFTKTDTHINFTVDHFSGYGGGKIQVIDVQSYPMVGGNWTVRFNTTGTANLTITAVNGTNWTDYANASYDLKFLKLTCGNQTLNYTWINGSVFIPNYNCSSLGIETSKVITTGVHILEFKFGQDVDYAHNIALTGIINPTSDNIYVDDFGAVYAEAQKVGGAVQLCPQGTIVSTNCAGMLPVTDVWDIDFVGVYPGMDMSYIDVLELDSLFTGQWCVSRYNFGPGSCTLTGPPLTTFGPYPTGGGSWSGTSLSLADEVFATGAMTTPQEYTLVYDGGYNVIYDVQGNIPGTAGAGTEYTVNGAGCPPGLAGDKIEATSYPVSGQANPLAGPAGANSIWIIDSNIFGPSLVEVTEPTPLIPFTPPYPWGNALPPPVPNSIPCVGVTGLAPFTIASPVVEFRQTNNNLTEPLDSLGAGPVLLGRNWSDLKIVDSIGPQLGAVYWVSPTTGLAGSAANFMVVNSGPGPATTIRGGTGFGNPNDAINYVAPHKDGVWVTAQLFDPTGQLTGDVDADGLYPGTTPLGITGELVYGSNLTNIDSDAGGENESSENAGGRDPIDPADDIPPGPPPVNCGYLNSNTTLTSNVTALGNCFIINRSSLTLDCASYNITDATGAAIGVIASGKNKVTVKNCNFFSFATDILYNSTTNSVIDDTDVIINITNANNTNVTNSNITNLFVTNSNNTLISDCTTTNYALTNARTFAKEDTNYGKVIFLPAITVSGNNLDANLAFSSNRIFIDSVTKSAFNVSSDISIYTSFALNSRPLVSYDDVNFNWCTDCTILRRTDGILQFNTTHNTIYRAGALFTENDVWSRNLTKIRQGGTVWGDLNKDGWMDLISDGLWADGLTRQALVYISNGTTLNYDATWSSQLDGSFQGALALGDVNNDDKLDLVHVGHNGTSYFANVHLNNGTTLVKNSTWGQNITGMQFDSTMLTDINNDGLLDLVITGYSIIGADARVYINNGTAFNENAKWEANITKLRNSYGNALGDFDGDGDFDLITSGGTQSLGDLFTKFYINNGTAFKESTVWKGNVSDISYGALALGDVDNDADLDLILAGQGVVNKSDYCNQSDTCNQSIGQCVNNPGWGCGIDADCAACQISGQQCMQGNLDCWTQIPKTRVCINNGTAFNEIYSWYKNMRNLRYADIALGDIDVDGNIDVVISGNNATNILHAKVYLNNGSTFIENSSYSARLPPTSYPTLALSDFDNDTDLDLAFMGRGINDTTILCNTTDFCNQLDTCNLSTFLCVLNPTNPCPSGANSDCWYCNAVGNPQNNPTCSPIWGGNGQNSDCWTCPGTPNSCSTNSSCWTQGPFAIIFENLINTTNTRPNPPNIFSFNEISGLTTLTWSGANDSETPATGLYYNLRAGSAPGGSDIVTKIFGGSSRPAAGYFGNMMEIANFTINSSTIPFYWAVQSIDPGMMKSVWSAEQFTGNGPPTQDPPILNSTFGTNKTTENLTVYPQNVTDPDNDSVTNITNWYKEGRDFTVLNMPFDTNDAATAKDYSTYQNNGTVQNATWTSSGISGGAYAFNGVNATIQVPDSASLSPNETVTVEGWFYYTSTGRNTGLIWKHSYNYILYTGEGGLVKFNVWNTTGAVSGASFNENLLAVPGWNHIVGVFDGTKSILYLNGTQTGTNGSVIGGGIRDQAGNLFIGKRGDNVGLAYFNGTIDEVEIYPYALTPQQIVANYNSGAPNYKTIVSQETDKGEVWYVDVTPNDATVDGIKKLSNGVQVSNAPTQTTPVLVSSGGGNGTNENLILNLNVSDIDGDSIANVTNWFLNGTSLTVLNMPFNGLRAMHAVATTDDKLTLYFENNTNDFSGNGNNWVCTSCPAYTTSGQVGGAYVYDGIANTLNISDDPSLNLPNDITISAWVKLANSNNAGEILSKQIGGLWINYRLVFNGNTFVYLTGGGGLANQRVLPATTVAVANRWYHVVATRNGTSTNMSIYVNGVKENEIAGAALSLSSNPLFIGSLNGGSNYFNGTIDEVHVINRTLNPTEVTELYKKGLDSTKQVYDYSPYREHNAMPVPPTQITGGIVGGAYSFDGFNDVIYVPDDNTLDLNNDFSIGLWVNPRAPSGPFIGKAHTGGLGAGYNYNVRMFNNKTIFQIQPSGAVGAYLVTSISSLALNQWNYVVATFDNSTRNMSIYINGTYDNSIIKTAGSPPTSPWDVTIGRTPIGLAIATFFLNGSLDEVKIYNHTLTPEQIAANYNSGAPKHTKIVSQETDGEIWYAESTPNDGIMDGITKQSNSLDVNGAPTQDTPILNSTFGTNGTEENLTVYPQNVSDPEGQPVKNITSWNKDGNPIMVLNMPFEGGSNSTFTRDYSGWGNNGTVTSAQWNSTAGYDGWGAYKFNVNGPEDIDCGNAANLDIKGPITISVWIKPTQNILAYRRIVEKNWQQSYYLGGGATTPNGISFGMDANGVLGNLLNTAPNVIPVNAWTHVVGRWDGSELRIYLNGQLNASKPWSNTPVTGSANNVRIGHLAGLNTYTFPGWIDEVRIYNSSLSDQQILALYNNRTDLIVSQETSRGDVWQACLTPNDRVQDGVTKCSNNLTVLRTTPILNSTYGTNGTDENLTVYAQDSPGAITNITNWYRNGTSITVLNMPFDTNSSSNVRDYTPYQNNGTANAGVNWNSSGISGGAYDFDGATGNIIVPDANSLDLNNNFSIGVWVKPQASSGPIIGKAHTGGVGAGYNYDIRMFNNKAVFHIQPSGVIGAYLVTSVSNLTLNQWNYIVATFDNSTQNMSIYINGTYDNSITKTVGSPPISPHNLTIGRTPVGLAIITQFFNGTIDEVRIYNRTLSAQQIKQNYNSGVPKYDVITSDETEIADTWQACVTPNNAVADSPTVCSNNLTIVPYPYCPGSPYAGILTIDSNYVTTKDIICRVITINNSAILSVNSFGAGNRSILIKAENLTIATGSSINGTGLGYPRVSGPGAGQSFAFTGTGAGHGGYGGGSVTNRGQWYGVSFNPITPGSGGGSTGNINAVGGAGGAAIKINATNNFVMNGSVVSDGIAGTATPIGSDYAAGGGAGGSIWITADYLTGFGNLSAKGGAGGSTPIRRGGGGGGGRIAVYYNTTTWSTNRFNLVNVSGGPEAVYPGKVGTAIFIDPNTVGYIPWGFKWQHQETSKFNFTNLTAYKASMLTNMTAVSTTAKINVSTTCNLTKSDWANLVYSLYIDPLDLFVINTTINQTPNNATNMITLNATRIFIQNNSIIKGNSNITAVNITIDSTTIINASEFGYSRDNGPGKGVLNAPGWIGGGGGYGGNGGVPLGGPIYNSSFQPITFGSGGASTGALASQGGHGGGLISITAADVLNLNGNVISDGGNATGFGAVAQISGGGSGGGIYVSAYNLTGSANLTARGRGTKNALGVNQPGSGGGGGRIAVYYNTTSWTITDFLKADVSGGVPITLAGVGNIGEVGTVAFIDKDNSTVNIVKGFQFQTNDETSGYLNRNIFNITNALARYNNSVLVNASTAFYLINSTLKNETTGTSYIRAPTLSFDSNSAINVSWLDLAYTTFSDTNANYRNGFGLTLEKINFAEIAWLNSSLNNIANLSINVKPGNISAFSNSTALPSLNQSANITFFNVNLTNPSIIWDPEDDGIFVACPANVCAQINYSGTTFLFNVTRFTNYSLQGGAALSVNTTVPDINVLNYRLDNQKFSGLFETVNASCTNCTYDEENTCQLEQEVLSAPGNVNMTLFLNGTAVSMQKLDLICTMYDYAKTVLNGANCSGSNDNSSTCANWVGGGNTFTIDLTNAANFNTTIVLGNITPVSNCSTVVCYLNGSWAPGDDQQFEINKTFTITDGTNNATNPNGTLRFTTDKYAGIETLHPDINILNFQLDFQAFNGTFDTTLGTCINCTYDLSNGTCQAEVEKVFGMFQSYNLTINLTTASSISMTNLTMECRTANQTTIKNSNCAGLFNPYGVGTDGCVNWVATAGKSWVIGGPANQGLGIDMTGFTSIQIPLGTISPTNNCKLIACEVTGTWASGDDQEFIMNKTITVTAI